MSDHATNWDALQHEIDHLTPAEKLRLIEHTARSLREPSGPKRPEEQHATLDRLRREVAVLPVLNPNDGFSGRDHDKELYGGS